MRIRCPNCSTSGTIINLHGGVKIRCPKCGHIFNIHEAQHLNDDDRRSSKRVVIDDTFMNFGILVGISKVLNINKTGACFIAPETEVDLNVDYLLTFALENGKQTVIEDLQARIIYFREGNIGCKFSELDQAQENEIHWFIKKQEFDNFTRGSDEVRLEMDEQSIMLKAKKYL